MDRNKGKGKQGTKKAFLVFAAAMFLFMTGIGGAFADYTLELSSGGSTTYPDTVHGSLYVGPYQISVNGAPSIPMICDDYATEIGQGSTWTANAYTFGQLSQMKFFGNSSFGNGALNATQAYEEVFYLSAQMMHQPSTNYAAIAYAIWQIMDPKDNPAANGPSSSATWLAQAAIPNNWQNVNTADFTVYTPSPFSSSQEFIKVVPIPPSVLLLGTGLLGFVGLRKRPKM